MLQFFALVAAIGLFASAKPVPAQDSSESPKSIKFLIADENYVWTSEFDGNAINLNNFGVEKGDRTFKPTWMRCKLGWLLDIAYNKESNTLKLTATYYKGSIGVSHMTYNKNCTRLLATNDSGSDIWDSSASDGSLKLLDPSSTGDNSTESTETYMTQIEPDPSGRIYVVSDRRANSLIIVSAVDDNDPKPLGMIPLEESCGTRRGAFYAADGQSPTRYFALCQVTKELLLFEVDFSADTFKPLQKLQTSVGTKSYKRSVADLLLQTNSDRSADIYVTNTFVYNGTVLGDLTNITSDRIVSSIGVNPNSNSLDSEGEYMIVGNQQAGPAAVAVLKRDKETGALDFKQFTNAKNGLGPSLVMPISI